MSITLTHLHGRMTVFQSEGGRLEVRSVDSCLFPIAEISGQINFVFKPSDDLKDALDLGSCSSVRSSIHAIALCVVLDAAYEFTKGDERYQLHAALGDLRDKFKDDGVTLFDYFKVMTRACFSHTLAWIFLLSATPPRVQPAMAGNLCHTHLYTVISEYTKRYLSKARLWAGYKQNRFEVPSSLTAESLNDFKDLRADDSEESVVDEGHVVDLND